MCRHSKALRIRLNPTIVQCMHPECAMRRYTLPISPGDPDFDAWTNSLNRHIEPALADDEILFQPVTAPPLAPYRWRGGRVVQEGGNFWTTTGTTTNVTTTGIDENG